MHRRIYMNANILHLSNLLGEAPAFSLVAAVYGTQGKAQGRDGLTIRYPDGTETFHPVPAGSRDWLRALFPWLGWRAVVGHDADYNTYVFRFSTYQDALVTKTRSRVLCAQAWGVLR